MNNRLNSKENNPLQKTGYKYAIMALLVLCIIALYVLCNSGNGNFEVDLKGGKVKVEISEAEVSEKQTKLIAKAKDLKNQKSLLEKLKIEVRKNSGLQRQIDSLQSIVNLNVHKASELVEVFEVFSDMKKREKQLFLKDVYEFLDESSNPNLYKDQAKYGEFLLTISINDELTIKSKNSENERRKLEEENRLLLGRIDDLNRLLTNNKTSKEKMELAYQELDQKYKKSLEIISNKKELINNIEANLKSRLTSEESDALKAQLNQLASEKEILSNTNSKINELNNKLSKDLSKTSKYSVNGGTFEPKGVKRRKDQTFDLKKMNKNKSITFSFQVKGNISSTNGETIQLKIIAHIPEKGNKQSERLITQNITAIVGKKKIVELPIKGIDFGEGLYKVQILHEPTSETIPLEILYFNARGLFDKKLK